jgi:hypothetical protein
MARLCGASKYLECSSLTGEGGGYESRIFGRSLDQVGGGCCTIQ